MQPIARTRRSTRGVASLALALLLTASATLHVGLGGRVEAASRPNIVVVMTDDQAYRSLARMPSVKSDLVERGTTYRRAFVNFPLCCPSRATFLTGQYFHNHRMSGSYHKLDDSDTLPVWLRRAGYVTGFAGKYLNGYGSDRPRYVPPGWNEWHGAIGATTQHVYAYELNDDGDLNRYRRSTADFKQDVITQAARNFVRRRAPDQRPFFLYVAYTAPHVATGPRSQPPRDCEDSPQPAARHARAFDAKPLPRGPSFNELDVSDKPRRIRRLSRLDEDRIRFLARRHRCMLESLQSVDEGVAGIVDELRAAGELADTYIVFTSDNGFFYRGEHRLRGGKNLVYEEAIRVPLVIRGPGFPDGRATSRLTVNPDLTRTILDAANVAPGLRADGVSLFGTNRGRKAISIESRAFSAARTRRYIYARHETGERELYDLKKDPHELENLVGRRAYADVRRRMKDVLARVSRCAGASCR